ncbi:MAG: AAA family ATPase [Verrucomicrobiota bacterium]
MAETRSAKVIVISGPAGSGKTTLCDRLLAEKPDQVARVVTSTTRQPRPGEQHGIDYYYFPSEEFLAKVLAGDFYEHAQVHTNRYGTLKSEVDDKLAAGTDVLLNIDVQGAATWRQVAAESPELRGRLVTIFINITPEQMRERMLGRGDSDEQDIARRLETAKQETARASEFDHTIDSTDKESDYQTLCAIYERIKRSA